MENVDTVSQSLLHNVIPSISCHNWLSEKKELKTRFLEISILSLHMRADLKFYFFLRFLHENSTV